MAIATKAKAFLASPVTQKVVNDVYYGRIVFTMSASRSILADNYKHKAIEIYDSRDSPFLNHYRLVGVSGCGFPSVSLIFDRRLRVPFYGAILEFLSFVVLLITFVLCPIHLLITCPVDTKFIRS